MNTKENLSERLRSVQLTFLAWMVALGGTLSLRAQTAKVTTDHYTYLPGEAILATFEGGPGNPKDWVGVYPDGVEPGSQNSTIWFYTDNTQTGTKALKEGKITFNNGLAVAGDWVAFFLLNDGYTKLAETKLRVVDPTAPFVRPAKNVYGPNETLTVAFTNGPANPKDWVAIYPEGKQPGSVPATIWFYVNGSQTSTTGTSEGLLTFASGLKDKGNYVAYLLLNGGYDIIASEPFTVADPKSGPPRLLSVQPPNNATNTPPVLEFVATITNGVSKVASNSVVLSIDNGPVAHELTQAADLVTIWYANDVLLAPGSTHNYTLKFSDDANPPATFTEQGVFTVAQYRNVILPAPLYFENFDNVPEGQLPAGWTETSYTEIQNPDIDFGNLDSAAYGRWTVLNADRFQGSFVTYSNPDNPQAWEDDYHRVLSVNSLNVVNGKLLKEPLGKGRFLFGDSGYRNGQSQVLYLFTPDFNLAGKSDVHLSFHSLWEQNQDSIGTVEYSIDAGQSWLPIVYLIDGADVVTVTNEVTGAVSVDAVETFNAEHADVARYTDPVTGAETGGSYGAFIAAPIAQDLTPFISARRDDNPVESKRVELFRLPRADNQAKVRFRFAHAGTDSWYFGVDDFGLYSIPPSTGEPVQLRISQTASGIFISWSAAGATLESTDNLTNPVWTPVIGVSNNSVTVTASSGQRFYRLRNG